MSASVPRISRRKLITRGLTAVAGISSLGVAAKIADHYGLIPPDWGGVWGAGETLTYAAQRILMSHHSMAREFNRGINPFIRQNPSDAPI